MSIPCAIGPSNEQKCYVGKLTSATIIGVNLLGKDARGTDKTCRIISHCIDWNTDCERVTNRRREKSNASRSDLGWRRNMASLHTRSPREAHQIWQVLVLVLLVTRGWGVRLAQCQRNCCSSLGWDPQYSTWEAYLECHGKFTSPLPFF